MYVLKPTYMAQVPEKVLGVLTVHIDAIPLSTHFLQIFGEHILVSDSAILRTGRRAVTEGYCYDPT